VQILEAISRVLPVILLLILGVSLNRLQFIGKGTIQDLKRLVVNITLPAVLFLAFSRVDLESSYLVIVALVFLACVFALLVSRWIQPLTGNASPYFSMLMTGFEAGMLGYAIFGSVYGAENIYKFGVVDLGQVTFVFFILVTFLERTTTGPRPFSQTCLNFFKTPVILAIFLGILFNQAGLMAPLSKWPVSASILRSLELVAGLTTPLVALVIGYEMRLVRGNLLRPSLSIALSIGIRLLLWVPAGLLLSSLVVDRLLHLDPIFQAAVMTMVILPPPFVIPLFMSGSDEGEQSYVVNTLSIGTLVTLIAFAVISLLYSP
jgi:malate permease and related proteins